MRAALLVLAMLVAAPDAHAQTTPSPPSDTQPSDVEFFSRFDSAISIERFSAAEDERFVWSGNVRCRC